MASDTPGATPLPQWAIEVFKALILKKMMLRQDAEALLLCEYLKALNQCDTQFYSLHAIAKLNVGEQPDLLAQQQFTQSMPEELSAVMTARCTHLNQVLS